jgi:uncharacterized membrane protein
MRGRRLVLGLLGVLAYAVASHGLMLHAADKPWAIAALLGPLLALVLGVALRRRDGAALTLTLLALGALAALVAQGGLVDVRRLYVAQHAGIHLLLFGGFAMSLLPGRMSLISMVAQRVHNPLSPSMLAYTRRITVLWAGYFIAMAVVSVWVYAACEWSTWSLLANLITPLVIVALFVGEYAVRYRLHPEFERSSLTDALHAYSRARPANEVEAS